MRWINNVAHEMFGLFVDDGSFAAAILGWLGVVWLFFGHMKLGRPRGFILFFGLASILVESSMRGARGKRKGVQQSTQE